MLQTIYLLALFCFKFSQMLICHSHPAGETIVTDTMWTTDGAPTLCTNVRKERRAKPLYNQNIKKKTLPTRMVLRRGHTSAKTAKLLLLKQTSGKNIPRVMGHVSAPPTNPVSWGMYRPPPKNPVSWGMSRPPPTNPVSWGMSRPHLQTQCHGACLGPHLTVTITLPQL